MLDFNVDIPNKSQFKLNEVSSITGVKPYVLRSWEQEFNELEPVHSVTGQKLYERKDIQIFLQVKKWLFDEKLTIFECKERLKSLDLGDFNIENMESKSMDQQELNFSLDDKEVEIASSDTSLDTSLDTSPGLTDSFKSPEITDVVRESDLIHVRKSSIIVKMNDLMSFLESKLNKA